jgi:hypothetical protein
MVDGVWWRSEEEGRSEGAGQMTSFMDTALLL